MQDFEKKEKKTYLVTGAAGFIGSRFVESCQKRNLQVVSVDHLVYFDQRLENRQVAYGTCVDCQYLWDWLKAHPHSIQGIVHLGAITDTRESRWDFLDIWNVQYSKKLWQYATEFQIPFVYASSAATYGDGSQGYLDDEADLPRLQPLNAYGQSKQVFDCWVLTQTETPPLWSGFKFFNVYGFGERHKAFMASVVLHAFDQIRKQGQVNLFQSHRADIADGDQKRDFVYVQDVVEVLHFALEHPIRKGIFNLGTGQARSFLDLARAVFQALGVIESIRFHPTPLEIRDRYQYFTQASIEKLRQQGFLMPWTSLERGVEQTVQRLLNHEGRATE